MKKIENENDVKTFFKEKIKEEYNSFSDFSRKIGFTRQKLHKKLKNGSKFTTKDLFIFAHHLGLEVVIKKD